MDLIEEAAFNKNWFIHFLVLFFFLIFFRNTSEGIIPKKTNYVNPNVPFDTVEDSDAVIEDYNPTMPLKKDL